MKELRKYFDPRTGNNLIVNLQTGIVRKSDGECVDPQTEQRALKAVRTRVRSQRTRSEVDSLMRDLGMIKVRGAVSGKVYWE